MSKKNPVWYYIQKDLPEIVTELSVLPIFIIDQIVYEKHKHKFSYPPDNLLILTLIEKDKTAEKAFEIIEKLMALKADRNSFIIAVGGGVLLDIIGFVSAIYMRGIPFGFVPTTLLAQVDAAMGGKNAVNIGVYKNLAGTFTFPKFILWDTDFLHSLPNEEWTNGTAEIIKHAAITDPDLWNDLTRHTLSDLQKNIPLLQSVIEKNIAIKTDIILTDPYEKNIRKLLNFGHTLGHAIEKIYTLPHGNSVAIGMIQAAKISVKLTGADKTIPEQLRHLLHAYGLPSEYPFDWDTIFPILTMDKKRNNKKITFILLEKIGKAVLQDLSFTDLYSLLRKKF